MITTLSLLDALGAADARMVTFVGAGGKTSAILRAAGEQTSRGRTVIATTTTLVGDRLASCGVHEVVRGGAVSHAAVADRLVAQLRETGVVFLHAGRREDGKFAGVPPGLLDTLTALRAADCILVEGDGARGLPIKMPDRHEPVIPGSSDIVVPVVGMNALDRPIVEGSVHRPRLFASLGTGQTVTPAMIVTLLASETGGMRHVPPGAFVRPLLNRAGGAPGDLAETIARELLRAAPSTLDRVIAGDVQGGQLRVYERHETVFDRGGETPAERS